MGVIERAPPPRPHAALTTAPESERREVRALLAADDDRAKDGEGPVEERKAARSCGAASRAIAPAFRGLVLIWNLLGSQHRRGSPNPGGLERKDRRERPGCFRAGVAERTAALA
jgi:hypothetical protein